MTNVRKWHPAGSVLDLEEIRAPLTVYDIEVEDEHVFYACRFLVHNCHRCMANQKAGPWPLGKPFPATQTLGPPAHPRCRCILKPAPPGKKGGTGKSERTPYVSAVHNPLGHEGLWHTPDRHVSTMQQLPAYIQNAARALIRAGHDESSAIALAVQAVKDWAAGHAFGGRVEVTPEVQAAAQRALDEWEGLRASHAG
jgi:hypothetical protein